MEYNKNNNSLTRLELSDALVREVGLSRHESMQLVDDVLDHLSNSLALGENVKISSFGTFSCRQKKERIGRNPKTLEKKIISPLHSGPYYHSIQFGPVLLLKKTRVFDNLCIFAFFDIFASDAKMSDINL